MVRWPEPEEEEISPETPHSTTLRFLSASGTRVRKMRWADGRLVGNSFEPRERAPRFYVVPGAADDEDTAIGLGNWKVHSTAYTARRMRPAQYGRRHENLPSAIGLANWGDAIQDTAEQGVWAGAHMMMYKAGKRIQKEPTLDEQLERVWAKIAFCKRKERLIIAQLKDLPTPREDVEVAFEWPASLEEENVADVIALSEIAQSIAALAESGVPIMTLAQAGVLGSNNWDAPAYALEYECCRLGAAIAAQDPLPSLADRDYMGEEEDITDYYAAEAQLEFRSLAGFHPAVPLDFAGDLLEEDDVDVIDTPVPASPVLIATPKKSPAKRTPTRAQLNGSPYKQVKEIAAGLGINMRFATKNELVKAILTTNEGYELV